MPSAEAVLVLSPHPDDETFGCGGTIKLLTEAGAAVDVLYLTHGELGTASPEASTPEGQKQLAATRACEAQEACRLLGVRQVEFLAGRDGQLGEQPELVGPLRARILAGCDRVFCPWPGERHPDHAATFALLRQALQGCTSALQVWLYEVWTPLPQPNVFIPIDGTMVAKTAAARAHQSQLACLDYLSAFQGLAAYRSLFCPGSRYAEAFLAGESSLVMGS